MSSVVGALTFVYHLAETKSVAELVIKPVPQSWSILGSMPDAAGVPSIYKFSKYSTYAPPTCIKKTETVTVPSIGTL